MSRTAVIAGATGLIGSHCLRILQSDSSYSVVIALVRRPSGRAWPKVTERVVDFNLPQTFELPAGADVYCALGTTIRTAGSQEAFRKVDLQYVVDLARTSLDREASQFLAVSSVAADAGSSNFYLRTKGEMEQAITAMPFHAVHIVRPSVLTGERPEMRLGERVGAALTTAFGFAMIGGLRKYRAIQGETVAASLVAAARQQKPGVHIYEYEEIQRLAGAA